MEDYFEDLWMDSQPSPSGEALRELQRAASVEESNLDNSEQRNETTYESATSGFPPSSPEDIVSLCDLSSMNPIYCTGYVCLINPNPKVPKVVIERLTKEQMQKETNVSRKDAEFSEDVHSADGVTLNDYKDSIFVKGHLAAAANHKYNLDAYRSTFLIINLAPMYSNVNCRLEEIEKLGRDYAKQFGVYIFTLGYFDLNSKPTFMNENKNRRVRVPDGFIKVFVRDNPKLIYELNKKTQLQYSLYAYMVKNKPDSNVKTKDARETEKAAQRRAAAPVPDAPVVDAPDMDDDASSGSDGVAAADNAGRPTVERLKITAEEVREITGLDLFEFCSDKPYKFVNAKRIRKKGPKRLENARMPRAEIRRPRGA